MESRVLSLGKLVSVYDQVVIDKSPEVSETQGLTVCFSQGSHFAV